MITGFIIQCDRCRAVGKVDLECLPYEIVEDVLVIRDRWVCDACVQQLRDEMEHKKAG